ncbi:uncharacterized protein LOC124887106 [Capsicum annuum]|uniref:uncharacterized protein LOC124887106 n=1 Tax=Capsicum annuum TaxID=4072 RepID=UPI001FB0E496|nr:uncharacterized protein LOC124887106 [Capsicum annuum]
MAHPVDPNDPIDPNARNVPALVILSVIAQTDARPIREVAILLMNHVTNTELKSQQLLTRILELQLGHIAGAQNTRPQEGLPSDTEVKPNKVNLVTTRSGLQIKEEVHNQVHRIANNNNSKDNEKKEVKKVVSDEIQVEKKTLPLPFPQRKMMYHEEEIYKKFLYLLKQFHIILSLVDILQSVPKYGKYLNNWVANKNRLTEYATLTLTEKCTSKIQNNLPMKLKDPSSFTLQIIIGKTISTRGLCDLGESINLMPTSWYQKMGLGSPKPTTIVL